MQAFWTLARREVGAYFLSMTGYIIIASALFLMGFSFFDLLGQLHENSTPMPITELFFVTWYFWLILLLTSPAITMRLFAHEKFAGTFETLMTAPVSDVQVVLAKFAAALTFYVVMWLPLLGCLLVVRQYTSGLDAFDAGVVASTFLGILAGMALRSRKDHGEVILTQVVGRNRELVEKMGLDRIMTVAEDPRGAGPDSARELVPGETSRDETRRTMIEAHKNLIELDPGNEQRFQDVVDFLRESVKRRPTGG